MGIGRGEHLSPTPKPSGERASPVPIGHGGQPIGRNTWIAAGAHSALGYVGSPLPELSSITEKSGTFRNHSDTSRICFYSFVALTNPSVISANPFGTLKTLHLISLYP
jgi:hypothetical protein